MAARKYLIMAGLGLAAAAAIGFGLYKLLTGGDNPLDNTLSSVWHLGEDAVEGAKDLGKAVAKGGLGHAADSAARAVFSGVSSIGKFGKTAVKEEVKVFNSVVKGIPKVGHEIEKDFGKVSHLAKDGVHSVLKAEHKIANKISHGINKEAHHLEHELHHAVKSVGHTASKVWKSFTSIF